MISKYRHTAVVVGCLVVLIASCFGSVLTRDHQFGFRDAAHFYYPLYQRVQQEWQAGRLPLWEPEENGGMPLLGNPTAAVLYPGSLIYAVFPYPWAARLYVIAHVVLAFAAMRMLLRGWSVSPTGAALGGMAYAFGAPVLLQYCNVIFLVGAAWMPLGFRAADAWLRMGRRWAIGELALVLTMQTLGGDPEMAYVTGVCAAGYAVGMACAPTRRGRIGLICGPFVAYLLLVGWSGLGTTFGHPSGWPSAHTLATIGWLATAMSMLFRLWHRRREGARARLEGKLLGLLGAGLLAVLLSGIQLVPSLEFIYHSVRVSEDQHDSSHYNFSTHPARIVEGLWPNIFGTIAGENRRWVDQLPPRCETRIWVESLYLGGLTLILAVSAIGLRDGLPWRGWLTVVAAGALLASLGNYGSPLFWARSTPVGARMLGGFDEDDCTRPDKMPFDGDGGTYWFLATALPGFRSFRYPGKLLVPASLAICGLAGAGWDEWTSSRSRRGMRWARLTLAASLFALLAVILLRGPMASALSIRTVQVRSVFGPLDGPGAVRLLILAIGQGAAVSFFGWLLARYASGRPKVAGAIALAVLAVDLATANGSLILTVPQAVFDERPRALQIIEKAEAAQPSPGPFRIHRLPEWYPAVFFGHRSAARVAEIDRWERNSLMPKYAVSYRLPYVYTVGTTELREYVPFFGLLHVNVGTQAAKEYGLRTDQEVTYFTRRGFDFWNTRYFILPAQIAPRDADRGVLSFLPDTTELYPGGVPFEGPGGKERWDKWLSEEDVQILRNENAYPRAWVVHNAKLWPPLDPLDSEEHARRMKEILYQDDGLWHRPGRTVFDPRQMAWLEVEPRDRRRVIAGLSGSRNGPSETVTVDRYEPTRVELTARLESPGLVVLADVFYPGWRLTIDGHATEVLRANRMMRGALVKAGTHKLVYVYQPMSVTIGALLSLAGLIGLTGLGVWSASRSDHDAARVSDNAINEPGR